MMILRAACVGGEAPGRALKRRGMAAAGARAAGPSRRAGAHARDLRPARQAADRVGQRPTDDRAHRAAVDVVARSAVLRHVAGAAAGPWARVCSAPQCCPATIARARANQPHPDRGGTSRRRSWLCSSTATSRPRSRSLRLQARANISSKRIRRVQGAAQHPAHVALHCFKEKSLLSPSISAVQEEPRGRKRAKRGVFALCRGELREGVQGTPRWSHRARTLWIGTRFH